MVQLQLLLEFDLLNEFVIFNSTTIDHIQDMQQISRSTMNEPKPRFTTSSG